MFMFGVRAKALEIQVKVTEAERLVPTVCRTLTQKPREEQGDPWPPVRWSISPGVRRTRFE